MPFFFSKTKKTTLQHCLAMSQRDTAISEAPFGTPQISPKIRYLRFGLNLAASLMKAFDIWLAIMAETSCTWRMTDGSVLSASMAQRPYVTFSYRLIDSLRMETWSLKWRLTETCSSKKSTSLLWSNRVSKADLKQTQSDRKTRSTHQGEHSLLNLKWYKISFVRGVKKGAVARISDMKRTGPFASCTKDTSGESLRDWLSWKEKYLTKPIF